MRTSGCGVRSEGRCGAAGPARGRAWGSRSGRGVALREVEADGEQQHAAREREAGDVLGQPIAEVPALGEHADAPEAASERGAEQRARRGAVEVRAIDRKSTRLNS